MLWYYNFIVRRPYLMILGLTVLSLACIIVSLTINALPDFSDPTMGFEARGTIIGKRLNSWHNLLQEIEPSGVLVADPNDLYISSQNNYVDEVPRKHKHRKHKNHNHKRKNKIHHHNKHKNNKNNKKKLNSTLVVEHITTNNISTVLPLPFGKELQSPFHEEISRNNLKREIKSISSTPSAYEWNGDNGVIRNIWNSSINEQQKHFTTNRSFEYGRNLTYVDEDDQREKIELKENKWQLLKNASMPVVRGNNDNNNHIYSNDDDGGYFCDNPHMEYSHFVVERIGPNSTDTLFNLNGLLAICQLQEQISAINSYRDFCQRDKTDVQCCRPWSLANYVALLANKTSCYDLTVDNIVMAHEILKECFEYFHDLKLSNDCNKNHCIAPAECTRHDAVYNIFHYLTDYNFMKIQVFHNSILNSKEPVMKNLHLTAVLQ